MIVKTSKGFQVIGEDGKPLSKDNLTKEQAEKRLKEIEKFKHMKKKNLQELLSGERVEMKEVEILNNFPNTHGLEFTEEDLKSFVSDTNEVIKNGWIKPNIKVSHSDQQLLLKEMFGLDNADMYEELPNLGLLENLKLKKDSNGMKITADFNNIPISMKEKIFSGKLFTSLSPELVKNWRNTGRKIIRAVALSNIPSMKHVMDVPMSQGLGYRGNFNIEYGGLDMSGENDVQTNLTQEAVENLLDEKLQKNNEGLIAKLSESVKGFFKPSDSSPQIVNGNPDNNREQMVSLSEVQSMINRATEESNKQINDLKLQLLEKDKGVTRLSEDVKRQKLESKKAQANAICKQAKMDGVPPIVVSLLKPVLMSEQGEQVIKFSEEITNETTGTKETVDVEKPISSFVEDLFKIYPNKVNMSEVSKTFLSSSSMDEEKRMATRVKELMAEGKSKHEALMLAGAEIRR